MAQISYSRFLEEVNNGTVKQVEGEASVPFFSLSGSDFIEVFVGVGASRVRDLIDKAKKSAPSIIFIDELDAIGLKHGAGLGRGNDEREQTLNQLLSEMDGFERNENVIVMAATNRPDVLDPALLGLGRFDLRVTVDMPTLKDRVEVLKIHVRDTSRAEDGDRPGDEPPSRARYLRGPARSGVPGRGYRRETRVQRNYRARGRRGGEAVSPRPAPARAPTSRSPRPLAGRSRQTRCWSRRTAGAAARAATRWAPCARSRP